MSVCVCVRVRVCVFVCMCVYCGHECVSIVYVLACKCDIFSYHTYVGDIIL